MNDPEAPVPDQYAATLDGYFKVPDEAALYRASELSKDLVAAGLGPEDVVALHFEVLDRVLANYSFRERARVTAESQQFLLEMMVAYGVRYREYLEIKFDQALRDVESQASLDRQRAMDAERVGREKSDVLAVIAHELRTPLTAVLGSLDLAERSLSRGQTDRLSRLLGAAREAVDRLSRLTGDLMEASRGEAPALEFGPLDLRHVVEQACAWADGAATGKGLTLVLEPCEAPIPLHGNADALLSVLGNLLSNAVRYTPEGGRITVRHGRRDDECWVEVADTGPGMPAPVVERIFEKFYRSPEARQTETQGLGLGLSLVQQLVQVHRGRVEVESQPGDGSTFRIVLPIPS